MTDPRLYLESDIVAGTPLRLSREDSHYLISVMRRGEGDTIRIFNGRDGEWNSRVLEAHRKGAILDPVERVRNQSDTPDVWLLFAPVKRQKTELIIEKATELGARRIQPVITRRTQADRSKPDRLRLIAKEAAEQTERLDLPQLEEPLKLGAVLETWDASRPIYYCDEAGDDDEARWGGANGRARPMLSELQVLDASSAALLIGPEGGFSAEERATLRALPFVHAVSLGPRILRAETAAIAAMTIWQSRCGDWGGSPSK
jgi:16S rRNA (uracil1498-N3)-methyltransferase